MTREEHSDATTDRPASELLEVQELGVELRTRRQPVPAVRNVSLRMGRGDVLGLVGESGSGKSVTARAIARLLPADARVSGRISFDGRDVLTMAGRDLRLFRGTRVGMIFQDPMTSLNPRMTIGAQLREALLGGSGSDRANRHERAVEALRVVGIAEPERRLRDYPHQFSGGMRQRVMIAMATINRPDLLIADEPTTALDVTVQAQVLDLLTELNRRLGTAMLIISHNLSLVARICDHVAVMYGGRVVEEAPVEELFDQPRHPYTRALLACIPRPGQGEGPLHAIPGQPPDPLTMPLGCSFHTRCELAEDRCANAIPPLTPRGEAAHRAACWVTEERPAAIVPVTRATGPAAQRRTAATTSEPILRLTDVVRRYPVGRHLVRGPRTWLRALDGVSLAVGAGETLGVVGESGCGKSTLARVALLLESPDEGQVDFRGEATAALHGDTVTTTFRRNVQLVFQDAYASLDPRATVESILAEPLRVHSLVERRQVPERVQELLRLVGLPPRLRAAYPRQLSGGQRQRVGIARALAVQPALIVSDEPVSALDVSLQAQIVNLLRELQQRLGLAYIFIAHDLALVEHMSHRIAVMYLGTVVETGPAAAICARPGHPYTRGLIAAVPVPDPRLERRRERTTLRGEVPSPLRPPSGCRFHPRCPIGPAFRDGREACRTKVPPLRQVGSDRRVACHFAEELLAQPLGDLVPHGTGTMT